MKNQAIDLDTRDDECCAPLPRRSFLIAAGATVAGAALLGSSATRADAASPALTFAPSGHHGGNVEWFRLVPGFVSETVDAEGWPTLTGFDNGNPWGMYTAYLMATSRLGHRTWRIEQYMPGQVLLGHGYAQGTTMYLFEGSDRALLIDTGYNDPPNYPAPARRVEGQDDLVTVIKHLLGHENDGSPRGKAVDFVVANSHNHGDHTGKNVKMSDRTVYYPALDWPAANAPANYVPIVEGGGATPAGEAVGSIPLGKRTIEAINIYGHTAGSMGYLDRENRLVATGDALGSGFVYMQGGPLTKYQASVKHLLDETRRFHDIAVLPAHVYQLNLWDRRLPPTYGRPSGKTYVEDQLATVNGLLNGSIVAEPFIAAGRSITWARVRSAQICFRYDTIYPGGPFGGDYGPDILRVMQIPGAYKTSPWIDTSSPAIANIKSGLYALRDNLNTSLFLVRGSKRALLVGTGRGTRGTSAAVKRLVGKLPLDIVLTSDDPDQIGGLDQFRSERVFVGENFSFNGSLPRQLSKRIQRVTTGHVFDLGLDAAGRRARIEVVALSGHSPAGLTLLSVSDRVLFTGDALGEQYNGGGLVLRDTPTSFSAAFSAWRAKTDGRYDGIYTAHNYQWTTSPVFVDKVQEALTKLLTGQPTIPSIRPAGFQMVQSTGPADVAASILVDYS